MSSWPSAFTVTSAWRGCCVQETGCLLLIHHNYEHIHKYKLETAADLKARLAFPSCLRPGVMGKGRDAPQWLPAPGTLLLSQQSQECCWDAAPELETPPGVPGVRKCSGKATSPGARVLEVQLDWKNSLHLPLCKLCSAQHHRTSQLAPEAEESNI